MLRGQKIGLRARHEADVAVLHAELYDDVATRSRADSRAWRPVSPGSTASPYAVGEPRDDNAVFSVVDLADGALAGDALLWGIDSHNRLAHLGMSLRPAFRGRGLGTDAVRVLCGYGFGVLGMNRLQIETLADNEALIRSAVRVGFVPEGTIRRSAWVDGAFADEVVLGLLAAEYARTGPAAAGPRDGSVPTGSAPT
jgi:RimJ/RimL family protein N-acetyltransferase